MRSSLGQPKRTPRERSETLFVHLVLHHLRQPKRTPRERSETTFLTTPIILSSQPKRTPRERSETKIKAAGTAQIVSLSAPQGSALKHIFQKEMKIEFSQPKRTPRERSETDHYKSKGCGCRSA